MTKYSVYVTKTLTQSLTCSLFATGLLLGIGCQQVSTQQNTLPQNSIKNVSLWPTVHPPKTADGEEARIQTLVAKMTTEEKVGQILQAEIQSASIEDIKNYHLGSVLNGGGSLPYRKKDATTEDWVGLADSFYEASMNDGGVAIPIIWGTDAVHGHNNVMGATLFPHNIGLGAMHNPELMRKIGEVTAREVRATGIDWVFAPTIAVAQNDFWGRTYESYSEDPAIVAQYSKAMVEGLQGEFGTSEYLDNQHVLACAKHFLGDGGTTGGDDQGNTEVSESELIAKHNAGYPVAIESGVQSMMSSFSSWNGEKMHGNHYLLTDVLRGKMNFDGLVVGDWNGHGQVPGCTNESCAQAINAGVDLIMVPYDWKAMYANTLAQVKSGEIPMARLNEAVSRIIRVKIRGGLFDGKPSDRMHPSVKNSIGSEEHRAIARQSVRESLVLLKNNKRLLPLNPKQTILVAGEAANSIPMQSGGWSITWQGTDVTNDNFPGATSIFEGLKKAVHLAGGKISLSEEGTFTQKPDVAIVVFGEQPYAEGIGDRATLEFEPGHKKSLALLKKLKDQNIPVVSVFVSGRPMWVNPELNTSDAFVAAWLPGSEGQGIADVLLKNTQGKIAFDFKGKLSFSWPALPLQAEVNGPKYTSAPLFKLGYGLNYSSSQQLAALPEQVAGLTSSTLNEIALYAGRPLQPWIFFIRNPERDQALSGAFAALPNGDVKIQTTDKDVQEDALRFTWKDNWSSGVFLKEGKPIDLTPFTKEGTLSFDLNVNDFSAADLRVEISCGPECKRGVSLADYAKSNVGKGWQNISMNVSCFMREGDILNNITTPFILEAGGKGEIEFANVYFNVKGKPNFDCPKYETLSTTPATHTVYWAEPWWMPRHNAILNNPKRKSAELIMIGDSITEGWENAGKTVWQQRYAKYNALNLGFGGDRTEHVLWRLQHGEIDGITPKLAVIMIGTNNTGHRLEAPKQTVAGIKAILADVQKKLPNTKILLLAVFPRDEKPDTPMRKINDEVNTQIKKFADNRKVFYQDINANFLTDNGSLPRNIMPDLLHPNEQGYEIWGKAMDPMIKKLMAN